MKPYGHRPNDFWCACPTCGPKYSKRDKGPKKRARREWRRSLKDKQDENTSSLQ